LPIAAKYTLKKLVLSDGDCPFDEWFDALSEDDQVMVDHRFANIRQGSFGEINSVGGGVWELKFRKGAALRIYYGPIGRQVLLLVAGGNKRTQTRDIAKAKKLFQLFKRGAVHDEGH
jgi:putative addiction module killer protein